MMQQKLSKAIVFLMFPLVAGARGIKKKVNSISSAAVGSPTPTPDLKKFPR
ncbi:MAG: hypothetical protein M3Q07_18600 [Pseudobdellovibrionaceae bacterium]|nr:hypothetical protein [Pseudobdellovibrionaceae bacterium]